MNVYILGTVGADLSALKSAASAAGMSVSTERPAADGAVRLEGTVTSTDSIMEFRNRLVGMNHLIATAGTL